MSAVIAAGIYSTATGNGPLAAIVSTRVYPVSLPEIALNAEIQPCIVYSLLSREDEKDYKGNYISHEQWEFMCCAASYDVAHQIADALHACFKAINRATWSTATVTTRFQGMADEAFSAPELGIFAVSVSFQIDWV